MEIRKCYCNLRSKISSICKNDETYTTFMTVVSSEIDSNPNRPGSTYYNHYTGDSIYEETAESIGRYTGIL